MAMFWVRLCCNFAEGASGGREGRFEFADAEDLPISTETADGGAISDTPVLRTLTFLPADGSAAESREIPVTVHKRPLPIKIDNYEVAYGDEFRRSDLSVTAGGESMVLPQKEFMLLYKMASFPGRIFTRQQLMDDIWGYDSSTDTHTVDVHIARLRERFRDNPDFKIVTMRGVGYKVVRT